MTFNDIFKSSFLENVTSISILDMVLAMILAFAIGMFIFYLKAFVAAKLFKIFDPSAPRSPDKIRS